MPLLKIQTNHTPVESDSLITQASGLVAEILGKPEQYVMVVLEKNMDMVFGGSHEPLAYIELKSIGLPEEKTKILSARLTTYLAEKLGVAENRIYIEFANAQRHMWGWNGSTF